MRRGRLAARYSCTVMVGTSPTPRLSRFATVAWWIAWERRKSGKEEKVRTPQMYPKTEFILESFEKE